jgi:hypothetical protein
MRRAAVVQLCLAAAIVVAWLAPAPPSSHGPYHFPALGKHVSALPAPGDEDSTDSWVEADSTSPVWLEVPGPLSTIAGADDPLVVHARALESFGPRPPPYR